MTIHHHLNDATLLSYSAGSLPEAMSLVVATHLALCPSCRKKLSDLEAIGGVSLQDIDKMKMSSDALSKVMLQLDSPDDFDSIQPANDSKNIEIPYPLRNHLPDSLDLISWKPFSPGIKTFNIDTLNCERGNLRLLKIERGTHIPEHGHQGSELTLVLRGSYHDEIGHFHAGDIADLDVDINHQPISDQKEDCICLIATDAPLKFKTVVPKIMQYFTGV